VRSTVPGRVAATATRALAGGAIIAGRSANGTWSAARAGAVAMPSAAALAGSTPSRPLAAGALGVVCAVCDGAGPGARVSHQPPAAATANAAVPPRIARFSALFCMGPGYRPGLTKT